MRCATWTLATLVAVAVVGSASIASAVTMSTDAASSPSNLSLDFVAVGEDEETGDPISIILGQSGDMAVTGSAGVTVNLDGSGNGTLAFDSSSFSIADTAFTVDLSILFNPGNPSPATDLTISLVGVGLSITSSDIPVVGGAWSLDGDTPSAFVLSLNQGQLLVSGDLLDLLGEDNPLAIDLAAEPVSVSLEDLLGFGIGGSASDTAVGIGIPVVAIDIGAMLLDSPGILFLNLAGEINVAVPEPTTYAMLGMGIVGLVAAGRRRFRKA